jgi:hypothetical protein
MIGRPVRIRFGRPRRRLSTRVPRTVLERRRSLEAQRRGGPPPFAASVERGAARVRDAIRARLLGLRGGLVALRRRLTTLTHSRRGAGAY